MATQVPSADSVPLRLWEPVVGMTHPCLCSPKGKGVGSSESLIPVMVEDRQGGRCMFVPTASSLSLRQIPVSRERLQAKMLQMLGAGNLRVGLWGKVSFKTEQGTNTGHQYLLEM